VLRGGGLHAEQAALAVALHEGGGAQLLLGQLILQQLVQHDVGFACRDRAIRKVTTTKERQSTCINHSLAFL
jgi:hypothetical protein